MNHLPWPEFYRPSLGAKFIMAFETGDEIGGHATIPFLVRFGEENVDEKFQNKKSPLKKRLFLVAGTGLEPASAFGG
ncbi:MAG: hypothetical protein AAF090_18460 [Bacteroidota bacterium]